MELKRVVLILAFNGVFVKQVEEANVAQMHGVLFTTARLM
jgi:hypothetical protein